MAQLRQTVGDVVCPGTQGTAFVVGQGRDILTNAHIFVDENGKDRANLDKCFWQNKDEPFQRISVETDEHNMKLFTRSTAKEFYLDLAVVRLAQGIPGVHPLPFDARASVQIGEQLIMVSAGQLRMPSLPKPVTEFIRGDPEQGAFEFDYNREPILQGCTVMAVGRPADTVANDAIYSDCSATRGTSGSPILGPLAYRRTGDQGRSCRWRAGCCRLHGLHPGWCKRCGTKLFERPSIKSGHPRRDQALRNRPADYRNAIEVYAAGVETPRPC